MLLFGELHLTRRFYDTPGLASIEMKSHAPIILLTSSDLPRAALSQRRIKEPRDCQAKNNVRKILIKPHLIKMPLNVLSPVLTKSDRGK
jgi:hypothetical protein